MTPMQLSPPITNGQRLQAIETARRWLLHDGTDKPTGLAEWVTQSWQRCLQRGQRPNDKVEFDLIQAQRQQELQARHQRLREAAQPEIQRLCRAISGTQYFALLTDASGIVVDVGGAPDHRDRRVHAVARIGVDLSELSVGTSAIGTALGEQRSVWLHRGEHFFNDTSVYSCAGAPIAGPHGDCVGMLDLTGVMTVERPELQHLVALSARSIESALLYTQVHCLVLRLNWPGHLQNNEADACLLIDQDGLICGRNRLASQLLQLPTTPPQKQELGHAFSHQVRQDMGHGPRVHLTDVFAAPEGQIHDLVGRTEPTELPLWSGLTVQCMAHLPLSPTVARPARTQAAPAPLEAGPLKQAQDTMIARAIQAAKGNVGQAAKTLGISRATLYRHLNRHLQKTSKD